MHHDSPNVASLSLDVAALSVEGAAPTEFRIFSAGVVDTVKGAFLFDDGAARDVLAAYADHGADIPIDYDHAQVDPGSNVADRVAAGWFSPEVRGGELWAVDVKWTPRAAKALADREWRYISPAFLADAGKEPRRVRRLINVAITNLPATKQLRPLVASMVDAPEAPRFDEVQRMETVLSALSAKNEAEALAAVQRLQNDARDLLALTGKPTLGEALAVCSAWKEGAAKVAEVEAQLAARAKAEADAKATAAIELAVNEKRLAPGRKDVAAKLYADHGAPALEAFLSALSPIVGATDATPPTSGEKPERLSKDDAWAAQALGINPQDALKAVQEYGHR